LPISFWALEIGGSLITRENLYALQYCDFFPKFLPKIVGVTYTWENTVWGNFGIGVTWAIIKKHD